LTYININIIKLSYFKKQKEGKEKENPQHPRAGQEEKGTKKEKLRRTLSNKIP